MDNGYNNGNYNQNNGYTPNMNPNYQNNNGYNNGVNQYNGMNYQSNVDANKGLKTASIVLGVLGLLCMLLLPLLGVGLSIAGIVCGVKYKKKSHTSTGATTLSVVACVICCIMCIVWCVIGCILFSGFVETVNEDISSSSSYSSTTKPNSKSDLDSDLQKALDELEEGLSSIDSNKSEEYPNKYTNDETPATKTWPYSSYGKYHLVTYLSTGMGHEPDDEIKVIFELNKDGTFTWRDYNNPYNNYVKGTYKMSKGAPKHKDMTYYAVELNGTDYYTSGKKSSETYRNEYEIGLVNDGNDEILVYSPLTMSMYWGYLQ